MTNAATRPATGRALTSRAIVLARGLGTRMQRAIPGVQLGAEQAAAASAGLKGMIPLRRPFLEYLLSGLADSGIREVCLVVGPEHSAVQEHFQRVAPPDRVQVSFAVQREPLGTADALLAAEQFAAGEPALVLNSDNYYPVEAYAALRAVAGAGVVGFERQALVAGSNISMERVAAFAQLTVSRDGILLAVHEKTDGNWSAAFESGVLVGMNLWSVTPEVFEGCRRVQPSSRGELELPQAVDLAIRELQLRMRVIRMTAGVLDLSGQGDVAAVSAALRHIEPRP